MEPEDRRNKARRYGEAVGELWAAVSGASPSTYRAWEAGQERKRRRQAEARRRAGLGPAPFIESGCDGDPGGGP